MIKNKWVLYLLVTIVVLGMVLSAVACGGAPTTPTTPTTAAPTTAAPTTTTPTTATPTAGGIPTIPHTLEGRSDCLLCHGASGVKPMPAATHTGRTSEQCQLCHKPPQ